MLHMYDYNGKKYKRRKKFMGIKSCVTCFHRGQEYIPTEALLWIQLGAKRRECERDYSVWFLKSKKI